MMAIDEFFAPRSNLIVGRDVNVKNTIILNVNYVSSSTSTSTSCQEEKQGIADEMNFLARLRADFHASLLFGVAVEPRRMLDGVSDGTMILQNINIIMVVGRFLRTLTGHF